jgi:hypothetical protein
LGVESTVQDFIPAGVLHYDTCSPPEISRLLPTSHATALQQLLAGINNPRGSLQ